MAGGGPTIGKGYHVTLWSGQLDNPPPPGVLILFTLHISVMAPTLSLSRTVLVVGARGFLGSYMAAGLRAQGWTVRCLVRPRPDLRPDEVPGDIVTMTQQEWFDVLEGVSVVVNAAGILRETPQQSFYDIHVRAPLIMAQACIQRRVRVVQISALGNPADGEFIASKHQFDDMLQRMPVDAVILRPSVVYAPSGSYGGTSLLRALAAFPGRHLLPGDGHWTFQPVCAEDLARVVVAACTKGRPDVYEVGCQTPISLEEYQSTWRQWFGLAGRNSVGVPMPLVHAHVAVCEKLGRGPVSQVIWNMLRRGNRTQPGAFQRIVNVFGVRVRELDEVLSTQPAQVQDRWAAQLYFLGPTLKVALVALFALSAIIGLVTPPATIQALVHDSWLEHAHPVALARSCAVFDALLAAGLALSSRPRPWLVAGAVLVTGYTLAFGLMLPSSWAEPLGGLLKNLVILPALAVSWVLSDRR